MHKSLRIDLQGAAIDILTRMDCSRNTAVLKVRTGFNYLVRVTYLLLNARTVLQKMVLLTEKRRRRDSLGNNDDAQRNVAR